MSNNNKSLIYWPHWHAGINSTCLIPVASPVGNHYNYV